MNNQFKLGDSVEPTEITVQERLRGRHGDPPYRVTSISGEYLRVNGDDGGNSCTRFKLVPNVGPLDFIEPVALTSMGTIYKHVRTGTYSIKLSGDTLMPLTDKQTVDVKTYLKTRKPFDDKLFTV